MANTVVIHPINDNQLRINNKEYTGLEISNIYVGVENTGREEILTDPDTGLNYTRNAVEAQEIYNLEKQKHHPWFILDLETGKRGYYPGCEIHGDILGNDIEVKAEASETSETVETISHTTVKILDLEKLSDEPIYEGWHHIKDGQKEGYVKTEYITNLRYEDPF